MRATLLILLLAGVALVSACDGGDEAERPRAAADPAATQVGTPAGRFVGSQTCRPCHEEAFAAWTRSHHRAALSRAVPPWARQLELPAGSQIGYVARGRHREDLWVRLADGRLQVFPVSFDRDAKTTFEPIREITGADPPADSIDHWRRVGRSADLTCYGCHATGAVTRAPSHDASGFAIPASRWREAGVGCEACHGPSGPHVDAAREGRGASVRPPHTGSEPDAELRVAVCAGCHGLREILSSPFRQVPAHGYGLPVAAWADPVLRTADNAEFRAPFFADLRPNSYQQEAIALGQSGCVQRGGLDCSHCHDVHSGALRREASTPAACLPCHRAVVDAGPAHTRHPGPGPGSRCIDCHMGAFLRGPGREPARDHTLAPPTAAAGEVPAVCVRCHEQATADWLRRGWSAFGQRSNEARRRHAVEQALAGARTGAPGAAALLATIVADPDQGWFVRAAAASHLVEVLAVRPDARVGGALEGSLDDANPAVRRAVLRTAPGWARPGDLSRLRALARDADPYVALEAVGALAALRSPEHGALLTELARRPDMAGEYRVHLALGRAALLAEDWPRAERALLRALELRPFVVPAWNDLGIALFRQGKTPLARQAWQWALQLNPAFEASRRNLAGVETSP